MSASSKKIVIIEDDPVMIEILARKLTTSNFDVTMAHDGKKGLSAVIKTKPDLVILDLMLPEIDGFQVLETLRNEKDEKVKNVNVLVVSNLWSQENIERLKPLNTIGYIVKANATAEEILDRVNEVLK